MAWKVLKHENEETANGIAVGWFEKGEHESDTAYYVGHDAAQTLGQRFGAGSYLLLSEEGRYVRIEVGQRQEFFEIEAEPVEATVA